MKEAVILMILGIIVLKFCDGTNLTSIFRLKRAEPDFILHSCTASAQLTRKHRTNDAPKLVKIHLNTFTAPSLRISSSKIKSSNTNKFFSNDLRSQIRSKGRYLSNKNATDTPLRTVDVKTIYKDIPIIFKKKDPLPELFRNSSARNVDTDTPIIVVQTLH